MSKFYIGGKEREFKLGTLGVSVIEEDLNISFLKDVGDLFRNLQLRTIVAFTWGSLVHGEPRLEKATVASWIDVIAEEENVIGLIEAITEAVQNCGLFKGKSKEAEKKITGKKQKPLE